MVCFVSGDGRQGRLAKLEHCDHARTLPGYGLVCARQRTCSLLPVALDMPHALCPQALRHLWWSQPTSALGTAGTCLTSHRPRATRGARTKAAHSAWTNASPAGFELLATAAQQPRCAIAAILFVPGNRWSQCRFLVPDVTQHDIC